MSIPDRLVVQYLKALTEWTDTEIEIIERWQQQGSIYPMDLEKVLAGEVAAAIHGIDAAMDARAEFTEQCFRRTFRGVQSMPTVGRDALTGTLRPSCSKVFRLTST